MDLLQSQSYLIWTVKFGHWNWPISPGPPLLSLLSFQGSPGGPWLLGSFQVREGTGRLFRSSGPQLSFGERMIIFQFFPFILERFLFGAACPTSLPFAWEFGTEMVLGNDYKLVLDLMGQSKNSMTLAVGRHHSRILSRGHSAPTPRSSDTEHTCTGPGMPVSSAIPLTPG